MDDILEVEVLRKHLMAMKRNSVVSGFRKIQGQMMTIECQSNIFIFQIILSRRNHQSRLWELERAEEEVKQKVICNSSRTYRAVKFYFRSDKLLLWIEVQTCVAWRRCREEKILDYIYLEKEVEAWSNRGKSKHGAWWGRRKKPSCLNRQK